MDLETKLIIFDVGGVIVPERGDEIRNVIAEQVGLSLEEYEGLIEDIGFRATCGEITLLELYSEVVRQTESDIRPRDLLATNIAIYREECGNFWDRKVLGIIKKLRKNYTVCCLNNTEPEIAEFNKERNLFDLFDRAFISTEMGLRKPQPEIYLQVLKRTGFKLSEAVFIDDNQEYVIGAEKVGIRSLLYQGVEQLKKDFDCFGINYS